MDEPFTAAEAAIPGPQHPQAEPEAATPSTASQAQPSVPLGLRNPFAPSVPHQTVFAVTLSNAKSNTPDDEINADRSHQDAQLPENGEHESSHENITSHPPTTASTNLPLQQTATEGAEDTYTQMSQSGAQLASFTQKPVANPTWLNLSQQRTAFEGARASYMQMPQSGAQQPSFTQTSVADPTWLNLPQQQGAFRNAGASYMQMPQSLEGGQLTSVTQNHVLNLGARPNHVQAMVGAQVNHGLPGAHHQGHNHQSVVSTNLTGRPLTSTDIQLPDPTPRVHQTHLYLPAFNPGYTKGTEVTTQPLSHSQAPEPRGPVPYHRDFDRASLAIQLEAYNDKGLAKEGLLSLRNKLKAQKEFHKNAETDLDTQLPPKEHRTLALQAVEIRLGSRIDHNEHSDTIRGRLQREITKAECWIEWGQERNIDYTFHKTRSEGLSKVLNLLGPEPEMPSSSAPSHDDGHQPPAPQVARPTPLTIEQLALSQINVTDNRAECHWCRDEQPWGIPGGIHFKPSHDDDADADPVSTMCRTCFAHRLAIGTHAQHGPFTDLPRRANPADAYLAHGPKSYMRQTSCAVCSGLAVAVCGGCPLRVCVDCRVVLDGGQCGGCLDRLLEVYGDGGRRNDARLMGSGVEEEEGGLLDEEDEEGEEDDELIEGEFGRVWREIKMRDRGY